MQQVWQLPEVVTQYLAGVRGAIPHAAEQLDVMKRIIRAARGKRVCRFLDLGCGDGILAAVVMSTYPEARGVLVDFSEPMLKAARQRVPEAEFVCVDYGRRGWLSAVRELGPFDAIVSGFSIHHQPDQRKRELYEELLGLLEPGGVFLNIEHVASPSAWIEEIWDERMIDALAAFSGRDRREVGAEYHARPDKAANILAPVEVQCEWLREIGFSDVDCYLKIFELAVFGGRRNG